LLEASTAELALVQAHEDVATRDAVALLEANLADAPGDLRAHRHRFVRAQRAHCRDLVDRGRELRRDGQHGHRRRGFLLG
jgi:hypothetical protein